jgi:hypothetical protein
MINEIKNTFTTQTLQSGPYATLCKPVIIFFIYLKMIFSIQLIIFNKFGNLSRSLSTSSNFFFSPLVFISHNVCDLERRLITELIDSELCLIAVRANVHIHCKPCHLVHYIGSVPKTPILMNRMVKRIKNKILIESLH